MAALGGASWPDAQAAGVLGRLRGVPLAPETIRAVVAPTGTAVAAQLAAAAATAWAPPASAPVPTGRPPAQFEVALDGGWLRRHANTQGMETKVGVVHTGSERVRRTRSRLRNRRDVEEGATPTLTEFMAYRERQAAHTPNYVARQEVGQTVGSGAIEQGVDLVVNRRLKGKRGMRWWRNRAEGVIALRVAQLNGEWDQRLARALPRPQLPTSLCFQQPPRPIPFPPSAA